MPTPQRATRDVRARPTSTPQRDAVAAVSRRPGQAVVAGWTILVGWPLAVAVLVTYVTGRFGFSPTDEEWVLAGSWRILHGEIPHVDFVSVRPAGSALLHIVDFLIPGPLSLVSRTVTMTELTLATVALTALVCRIPYGQWLRSRRGLLCLPLAAAATLVNLHTFPVTPWHTIDGLFLAATGWYLIDSGTRGNRAWQWRVGLVLAGLAPLCKQSFAPVIPVAIALLVLHPAHGTGVGQRRTWRSWSADVVALLGLPMLYAVVVTADGGLHVLTQQLLGSANPARLLPIEVATLLGTAHPQQFIAALVAMMLLWTLRGSGYLSRRMRWLPVIAPAAASLLVVWATWLGGLVFKSSLLVFCMVIVIVLVDIAAAPRCWRHPGLLVLVLAWMAALSMGYPTTDLLGGSLVATGLLCLWRPVVVPAADAQAAAPPAAAPPAAASPAAVPAQRVPVQRVSVEDPPAPSAPVGRGRAAGTGAMLAGATAALVVVAGWVLAVRDVHVYQDLNRPALTHDAGSVVPAMRGIRTSEREVAYLRLVRDCVAAHPARWTAILPDNGAMYATMGLRNPFPVDWPNEFELPGDAKQRFAETASRLARDGDYLVLFQTLPGAWTSTLPPTKADFTTPLYDYVPPFLLSLRDSLPGRKITCGSLVGVYAPA